jgi:hypothetical protein
MSKIAVILILEHTCFLYASQPQLNSDKALNKAYSQYKSSNTHSTVQNQFSTPLSQDSISEFTEFILKHRL